MKITGRILKASRRDRRIRGLLLPFGEQGSTNLGKVMCASGALDLPEDPAEVALTVEHTEAGAAEALAEEVIAEAVELVETVAGIEAEFEMTDTPIADLALEAVEEGLRACLSVEVDDPVIRGGKLLAGRVSGAALVKVPAFKSARLVASDHGELDDDEQDALAEEITDEIEDASAELDDDKEKEPMTAARRRVNPPALTKDRANPKRLTAAHVSRLLAAAAPQGRARLMAALDQITQADVFDPSQVPQYLGELYSGASYVPEFAPLIGHAELTSMKLVGWRFPDGNKPEVGDWKPNATGTALIPSNEVKLEYAEQNAERKAAGWNVDRIHRDFPNPQFWDAFFRLSNESYTKGIDLEVRDYLVDPASSVPVTMTAIPAGVSVAAAKVVRGALALKNAQKGRATFAVLGEDLYEQWVYTRAEDALAYLAPSLNLTGEGSIEGLTVVGTSQVPNGTALVGVKATATLHELGGASPLRVSTEDLAHGNMTEAMFGYWGIMRHDAASVVRVEDPTP